MERSANLSTAAHRRTLGDVVVWCLCLVVVIGLPTSGWAQLNQTQHNDGWILAAAHAPGLEGSIWRTDLWVRAQTYQTGSVTLYFCTSNQDNTDAEGYEIEFPEDTNILYVEDVVEEVLGVGGGSWVGAIHYVSDYDVQVYARVYSISADGTQSYGQVIEGIPTSDMSMPSGDPDFPATREHQWMFALKHTADSRFRVNIGMVNPTATGSDFVARIFDSTGNNPPGGAASETVYVPPFSMVQLGDPFAEVNGGEWNAYVVRVGAGTEGSGNLAYASVVDNATNDAYFVRGVKLYTPTD